VGICDSSTGCTIVAAADGTECGPRSCAELAICISGVCRRGPTPDGFPCDDRDPCTVGDRCNGGRCLATSVGVFGVSTPTEVDLGRDVSDHAIEEAPDAVGVLTVGSTSAGGIDVVWAHQLVVRSDLRVIVLRTRIAPDLSVVFHHHLARAQYAQAAFSGDQLLLLTYNHDGCDPLESPLDPAPEWVGYNACGFVLHQFAAGDSVTNPTRRLPLDGIISAIGGATVYGDGPALAVDAQAAYVAIPKQQFDPVGWSLGVVRVDLVDHTTQASLLAMDESEGAVPFRHLRLAAAGGLSAVAYEREADGLTIPAACAAVCSDPALDGALCEQPLYRPVLTVLGGQLGPTVVEIARPRARAILFSPQSANSGVLLNSYDSAQNGAPPDGSGGAQLTPPTTGCPLFDRVSAFAVDTAAATVAIADLFVDGPGTVRALTAASLFGAPAALWHRTDGWIAIAGHRAGAPVSIAISHPQSTVSQTGRRFADWSRPPFALAATLSLNQGFIAALVVEDNPDALSRADQAADAGTAGPIPPWTSNGIALLTVGCGVAIPQPP
jgi:hypothetical protein